MKKLYKKEHKYTESGFLKFIKDGAECFWQFWLNHRVLIIDITGKLAYVGSKETMKEREVYERREYWTSVKPEQLYSEGYKRCEGVHDNLAWFGVPVLMKLNNIHTLQVEDPRVRDSPRFLYDRAMNNLTARFAKGLARAQIVGGMDIQKLLLMGGIAIAAIVGMKFLGVF